jgi:transcriptional regulator with XRE-family HTH domain
VTQAEAVKKLRETLQLSQEDFADRFELGRSFLSKLEVGKKRAPLDVLGRLAWCCLKHGYDELLEEYRRIMRGVLRQTAAGLSRPKPSAGSGA